MYQSQSANIVLDENQAVLNYIADRKAAGTNYFEINVSTSIAATYGSPDNPAVVVITDSSLKLNPTSRGSVSS